MAEFDGKVRSITVGGKHLNNDSKLPMHKSKLPHYKVIDDIGHLSKIRSLSASRSNLERCTSLGDMTAVWPAAQLREFREG